MTMFSSNSFKLEDSSKGEPRVSQFGNSVILNYPCESLTDCTNYHSFLEPGTYAFETWGAQGGHDGGKGGYSFGIISFSKKTKVNIFIGAKGDTVIDQYTEVPASYNGGGRGFAAASIDNPRTSGSGGGATDIRLLSKLLENRVIVSGGGGGSTTNEETYTKGGHGGGFIGGDGEILNAKGGTQTGPGEANSEYRTCPDEGTCAGKFGYGGESICWEWTRGGGGGGWYGGASGYITKVGPGAGGSGYVLTKDSFKPNNYFKQYPRYFMTNPLLIDGANDMPKCEGELNMTDLKRDEKGHEGNGCVRITKLSSFFQITCYSLYQKYTVKVFLFTLFYLS